MADYYSIIKKTIDNLGETSPQLREKIFSSARNTIHKQLENAENLSPEIIAQHKAKLEDAISALQAEHGQAEHGQAEHTQTEHGVTAQATPTSPQQMQPPAQQVKQVQASPEPVNAPTPSKSAPSETVTPTARPQAAPQQPITQAPETTSTSNAVDNLLSPNNDQQSIDSAELSIPDIPEKDARFASKSKGSLGRNIFLALIAFILIALGYLGWNNKDKITEMLESITAETEEVQTGVIETSSLAEEKVIKNENRLGSSGEEIAAEPMETSTDSTKIDPTANNTAQVTNNQSDSNTNEATPDTTPTSAATATETPEASTSQEVAVAQTTSSVLFYEEGSNTNAGERYQGNINWVLKQQKITDDLPEEPVIHANVKIAKNGLNLLLNIKRNLDPALAASHIVELIFTVPDDFSGRQIEDARSLVFKSTEEARGVALIGVPVKVSDGIFLIALSNVENARKQNLEVLSKLEWIDIPLKYETARRALLSFKKDEEGKKVFDEALAAWAKLTN